MARIEVAVGVLIDEQGFILISRRSEGSHQGGLWEFPGGKVEQGESPAEALHRELLEELGTQIDGALPLIDVVHDYGDKEVALRVMTVDTWSGEPYGAEGQPLAWVSPSELSQFKFPAANQPIVDALLARDFQ